MKRFRLPLLFLPPLLLLSLALLLALSGCRDGGGDRVTIRFWNGFTGPDGRTMLALVRRFNEENPDVRVTMQRMAWATYYNKLFVAGLGNRAPEVYVLQTDAFERFQRAGFLHPINDLMAGKYGSGLDFADFDPHVINTVRNEGLYYGVPLDAFLLGMYYNRELFRQAGIVDEHGEPAPPTNREEFMTALEKLRGRHQGMDTWGFVYTFFRTNIFAIMSQFGGQLFNEEGNRVLVNSEENIRALEFAVSLIQEHRLVPAPEAIDSWIGFRQGRVGMVFEGIYMLPDLQRQQSLDYGAAPIPLFGDQPATWMGSHNLCMRTGMDERQEEAAWRFIRFLSENSLDWAEGGQVPVRRSLRETERFQNLYAQSQFARQLDYGVYMPSTPFVFEYFTEFDLALERALRGRESPRDALNRAAANIEVIMRRYGIQPHGGES
jgi:multiple sugar transport system substrate-binding protein